MLLVWGAVVNASLVAFGSIYVLFALEILGVSVDSVEPDDEVAATLPVVQHTMQDAPFPAVIDPHEDSCSRSQSSKSQ